ncbi:DNA replication/repair protein RecF [Rubellicoccus peritrichatus]|uniref:DNA replication and repair protein RecF n=1 Tax=Rubellicoccus peritrichatus TaxID=3080537 RepID=A0AAQ3QRS2_9BACT|nr:DNA replication/repair protein RecF [Puniceicoccus sp. CR14]WOO39571.1 DNA replication/repair protein RecF [Puniceicoccus sp. CR14]
MQLNLEAFRNIASASLKFEHDRQFFLGLNGQGKTNALEAIGMISALRSFRTRDSSALIQHGKEQSGLYYRVEQEQMGNSEVTLKFSNKGKRLELDQNSIRSLGEYIGLFPSVVLASDDLQLIRGGPALRRRFLDEAFASVDKQYYRTLARYQKCLKERNRLLKSNDLDDAVLESFDKTISEPAVELIQMRRRQIGQLNENAKQHYRELSSGKEQASLSYKPDVEANDTSAYLKLLEQSRKRDFRFGSTSIGPHRDDVQLELNGRLAAEFGSEGQQRGLVLAMRLAQITFSEAITGVTPLILADDVLGELDAYRREGFWKAVGGQYQVFATGTTLPPEADSQTWKVWKVNSGEFS